MVWSCAAIDHGVTIFPNGKVGPCCQISEDYCKPISVLTDLDRFGDLKTETPPVACAHCINNEQYNMPSYRKFFNNTVRNTDGIQFVDIRNTNLCNLKCRYCGPHFSDKWGPHLETDISKYRNLLLTDSLHWMYFTGGEPLINPEHWTLLDEVVATGRASDITLLYNTNLTTLRYKDRDIVDTWSQFRRVDLQCSIDAVGTTLEYIRSGASWNKILTNLKQLVALKDTNIQVTLTPTLSLLNLWSIRPLFELAQELELPVNVSLLTNPSYLAFDALPDDLKLVALTALDDIKEFLAEPLYLRCQDMINNNRNSWLFPRTLNHILLLDNLDNEHLFDTLPFKEYATKILFEKFEDE